MAKKKTFEDNIERLEDILSNLSKSDISMNDTMKLYKEGLDLVVKCSNELNSFEQKIEELKIVDEES